MRPFRRPRPSEMARDQLEEAERDLLIAEHNAEAYGHLAEVEAAKAVMLRERIKRLQGHLKGADE